MKNHVLFEAMRRVYEMHTSAKAIDPEMMANLVQSSKGDASYSLGVACAFHSHSGALWDVFINIYDTRYDKMKHLTREQYKICGKELQAFWKRIEKNRHEYEMVAQWYINVTGC